MVLARAMAVAIASNCLTSEIMADRKTDGSSPRLASTTRPEGRQQQDKQADRKGRQGQGRQPQASDQALVEAPWVWIKPKSK